ncbi:hypothetical protein GJ496_007729 [Pomphorhynchus laevis]|nr:hypothetical protein GJ496_007729 [Pomphorhynchus laevis]
MAKLIGLTYNPDTCEFCKTNIKILGYQVSQGKLQPDPDRLTALRDLPLPSNLISLKRALGLFAYYSSWIPKFLSKIAPLKDVHRSELYASLDNKATNLGVIHSGWKHKYSCIPDQWELNAVNTLEIKKLHKKYAYQIRIQAREHFRNQNTLIHVDIPTDSELTVCGDIHGQYFDLLNIFDFYGVPSAGNLYLFNVDFVDPGSFSTECIFLLLAYKLLYPNHFLLTRGNHETISVNEIYRFMGEVKSKYEDRMFKLFTEIFNYLPLCYDLNNAAAVMHGGLFSSTDVTLDDVGKIDRNRQPPDTGIITDILWFDPCQEIRRHPSRRGLDYNLDQMLPLEGVNVMHDKQCITVFSAPNNCDSMNNKDEILNLTRSRLRN